MNDVTGISTGTSMNHLVTALNTISSRYLGLQYFGPARLYYERGGDYALKKEASPRTASFR